MIECIYNSWTLYSKLMSNNYIPPFTVSAEAINLIAQISAQIERYAIRLEQSDGLRLRKANRIKTIHSSLAIEGNKLTEGQVSDIIEGKTVVAPPRDIQEVKNAIATYDLFPRLDAFKVEDLLKAHGTMMQALTEEAGRFRRGGVGVFGETGCVHIPHLPTECRISWATSSDGCGVRTTICSSARACSITSSNSSIRSLMVTDAWGACGNR